MSRVRIPGKKFIRQTHILNPPEPLREFFSYIIICMGGRETWNPEKFLPFHFLDSTGQDSAQLSPWQLELHFSSKQKLSLAANHESSSLSLSLSLSLFLFLLIHWLSFTWASVHMIRKISHLMAFSSPFVSLTVTHKHSPHTSTNTHSHLTQAQTQTHARTLSLLLLLLCRTFQWSFNKIIFDFWPGLELSSAGGFVLEAKFELKVFKLYLAINRRFHSMLSHCYIHW